MVRVRMAPSPTGNPHIGWARTALFNWLFARHVGGVFVLRIEDTDQKRRFEGAVQAFDDAFNWLGFMYDEGPTSGGPYGPYVVSERRDRHDAALARLKEEGAVYPCFCSPAELDERRKALRGAGMAPRYDGRCRTIPTEEAARRIAAGERPAYRLKAPGEGSLVVQDLVRGDVTFDLATVDDFIVAKSDGTPTYNFQVVVDDVDMAISHVIRAEEHLSNTPKQILIYEALGATPPLFAHVPMVLAPDRAKLSKRHGATSLGEFREAGFLAEALANYLCLLGWHPGGDREFFTLEEAAELFTLDDVQKSAAIYDVKKLTWMNGQYLRMLDVDDLVERSRPFLERQGLIGRDLDDAAAAYLKQVVTAVRERVSTLVEVADAATYFYREVTDYDGKGRAKYFDVPGARTRLRRLADALTGATFTIGELEELYTRIAEEEGIPRGELIHPTRLAVTGRTMGPGLFEILEILGKERVVARLRRAADAASA